MRTPEDIYRELLSGLHDTETRDLGAHRRSLADCLFPGYVVEYRNMYLVTPHIKGIHNEEDVDFRAEIGYRTGTDNYMEFTIDTVSLDRSDIPLMTVYETLAVCGPCKGSSGSCPGFAPRFTNLYKTKHPYVMVIALTLDMKWTFRENKLPRPSRLSPIINRMSMADRMTDALLQRIMKRMKELSGLPYLGAGNCAGCQPHKCTVRKGETCTHPDKRTFSMESVGIDCDMLHMLIYNEHLPWYYKGTCMLPTYVTRYGGVFFNDTHKKEHLQELLWMSITAHENVRTRYAYKVIQEPIPVLQTIMSGVLSGCDQYVYSLKEPFIIR